MELDEKSTEILNTVISLALLVLTGFAMWYSLDWCGLTGWTFGAAFCGGVPVAWILLHCVWGWIEGGYLARQDAKEMAAEDDDLDGLDALAREAYYKAKIDEDYDDNINHPGS